MPPSTLLVPCLTFLAILFVGSHQYKNVLKRLHEIPFLPEGGRRNPRNFLHNLESRKLQILFLAYFLAITQPKTLYTQLSEIVGPWLREYPLPTPSSPRGRGKFTQLMCYDTFQLQLISQIRFINLKQYVCVNIFYFFRPWQNHTMAFGFATTIH